MNKQPHRLKFTCDVNTFRKAKSQEDFDNSKKLLQSSQNINYILYRAEKIIKDESEQSQIKPKQLKTKILTGGQIYQLKSEQNFSKTTSKWQIKKQSFFPELLNQQSFTERIGRYQYKTPKIKPSSQCAKTQEQFTRKQSERIESILGYNMTFYAKNLFKDLNYDPFLKKNKKPKGNKTVKFSKMQETFRYTDY